MSDDKDATLSNGLRLMTGTTDSRAAENGLSIVSPSMDWATLLSPSCYDTDYMNDSLSQQ